jgi:hypothetical protein
VKQILIILLHLWLIPPVCWSQEEQSREQAGELHELRAREDRPDFTGDEEGDMSLDHALRFRLSVNDIDPERLLELPGIRPVHVSQFALYRNFRGPFMDLMELQAIPSWDVETIRGVLPFLKLFERDRFLPDLNERLRKGEHLLLLRAGSSAVPDSMFRKEPDMSGSPLKLMFRYQYRFRNLLQWGVNLEKDPGEALWRRSGTGVDFISGHLSLREAGFIRTFVLGDFQVSLGQGLIHWQGLSFGMGTDAMSVLRQAPVMKPYNGADENRFHRGGGIQLERGSWSVFYFLSTDRKDANLQTDSIFGYSIRSMSLSGLHRTASEREDQDALTLRSMGAGLRFRRAAWHVGWQGIHHRFQYPMDPEVEPYRLYAIRGTDWFNHSVDWGSSIRNVHFFGEGALDPKGRFALLAGVLSSLHRDLDLGLVVRNIDVGYKAWQADAHTAQGDPTNEQGIYAGCVIRPFSGVKLDGWVDLSRFPLWKYRVDGPSVRKAFLLNLQWMPEKGTRFQLRCQQVVSEQNETAHSSGMRIIQTHRRLTWRTHFEHGFGGGFQLRMRADASRVESDDETYHGYLVYTDLLYKPAMAPVKLAARLAMFEADDFAARLFAYEHDVPFQQSMSAFYGRGTRAFMVMQIRPDRKLQYSLKAGIVWRRDALRREVDIRFQVAYRFDAK